MGVTVSETDGVVEIIYIVTLMAGSEIDLTIPVIIGLENDTGLCVIHCGHGTLFTWYYAIITKEKSTCWQHLDHCVAFKEGQNGISVSTDGPDTYS